MLLTFVQFNLFTFSTGVFKKKTIKYLKIRFNFFYMYKNYLNTLDSNQLI